MTNVALTLIKRRSDPDHRSYSLGPKSHHMAYQVILNQETIYRVVLEERAEGTYIFVFKTSSSRFPEEDSLQDNLEMAMRACEQDYGMNKAEWVEVSDQGLS